MAMTDTTADLLTRIRNAQSARKNWVDIPSSNFKIRILFILKEEHFIRDYVKVDDGKHGFIRVFLCYDDNKFYRITDSLTEETTKEEFQFTLLNR